MKLIYKFVSLFFLGAILATSCSKDELDIAALTDFPPGILSISPADNSKVVKGDFDVVVKFVDGTISPLASGSVKLKDAGGAELATASKTMTGTADSIVIDGASFNASSLGEGTYNIEVTVTDSKGQSQTRQTTFEISNLPFAANHDNMYLAGGFNGWGADVMTLVAPNTWEIKEVNLQGGEWKIKNCENWCDEDWGDPGCDGIMDSNMGAGGNGNTNCGFTGLVNIRFNDQTLAYTVEPAVLYAKNVESLYLLGTFNTFQGNQYRFNLIADNTWQLNEVLMRGGDAFRFAEMPDFMGQNFGDNDGDGIAEAFGSNIVIPASEGAAYYSITFNDRTLDYEVNYLFAASIGLIGSATPGGWDNDTDMADVGGGNFELTVDLIDGEAKFRANDSWDVNWGGADFPSGSATRNGANIPVTAGRYKVTFNPLTGEYRFEAQSAITSVGIIGSATPGDWGAETTMRSLGNDEYSIVIGLADGEAKFRANNDWAINWGAADFPSGTGAQNGPNIPVTAGIYYVTFNAATGAYTFAPATLGLIGSATPGGWDNDTDMTPTGVVGEVRLTGVSLGAGEAKFRANDAWDWNWGAGDFPTGTGVSNGANIPVAAGTYTVTFNVNTGAYSFE